MKLYRLPPLLLQKLIWVPTRVALNFFGHLEVVGLENLKYQDRKTIFACNHTSELDPILLPASLPFFSRFSPIFYASRTKDLYDKSGWRSVLYGGNLFKLWGAFPVFVGLKNYEQSMRHHIKIVNDGGSLCVFPEGRITTDGTIQSAKGGVAYLAYRTTSTIIPVRLEGAYGVSLKDFLFRRVYLRVIFGAPIIIFNSQKSTMALDDFKMYANYIMGKISTI